MFVHGWRTSARLPVHGEAAYPFEGDRRGRRYRGGAGPLPRAVTSAAPDLGVPDSCDEPSPENDWPIDDLDDWPFDDLSVDVARLRESLMESEADIVAGRTFGEDEIRAHYGVSRRDAN